MEVLTINPKIDLTIANKLILTTLQEFGGIIWVGALYLEYCMMPKFRYP